MVNRHTCRGNIHTPHDLDGMFVTHGKDQNLNPGTHIRLDMAVHLQSQCSYCEVEVEAGGSPEAGICSDEH